MKASGIGGQAVIEGIMMRNKEKYAIAVRKPDKDIEVLVKEGKVLTEKYKWLNFPIIRGIFNFVDSLVMGVSTISYSASFYDDTEEQEDTKADKIGKSIFKDKFESVLMAATIILSVLLAIGLFMLLPYYVSRLLSSVIASKFLLNFIEGILRLLIFLLYIVLISYIKDIKRTFMYHGAEHKCINCIEHGARLTVENVKHSSRFHKRCGTSFLFLVMFISVIFFIFIRVDNTALQLVIRLLLIPVVAGVSYEVIRWAGKNDSAFVNAISKPGLWLQKLTTKEPEEDMIEVAIKAVEAVFDVDAFLKEYYADSEDPQADMEAAEAEMALTTSFNIDDENKSRVIKFDKTEKKEEDDDDRFFNQESFDQESFNLRFEDSDQSESTIHDYDYGYDSEYDNYDGDDDDAGYSEDYADILEELDDIYYDVPKEQDEHSEAYDEERAALNEQAVSDESAEEFEGGEPVESDILNEETDFDNRAASNEADEESKGTDGDVASDENDGFADDVASDENDGSDEADDGFEFLDDESEVESDDIYPEDVPVFKQRRTE